MVEVPSLVGKSLDAAQKVLEDLHLPAGKISFEQKPNVAENIVLEQFPKPGKKVEGTAEISLVVSEAQVTSATKGQPPPPRVSNPHPVTPQSVWAVGDQGTILRTEDGGVTWKPQTNGNKAALYSVAFATPKSGWAVGGVDPKFGASKAIILHTEDGGSTWKGQTSGTTAFLNSVAFAKPR